MNADWYLLGIEIQISLPVVIVHLLLLSSCLLSFSSPPPLSAHNPEDANYYLFGHSTVQIVSVVCSDFGWHV